MQARGMSAGRTYAAEPDIAAWVNRCALNPARLDPARASDPAVNAALARLASVSERGLEQLAELAGLSPNSLH